MCLARKLIQVLYVYRCVFWVVYGKFWAVSLQLGRIFDCWVPADKPTQASHGALAGSLATIDTINTMREKNINVPRQEHATDITNKPIGA